MQSTTMSGRFDHIDLRVPSLEQAKAFYTQLLPALGFSRDMNVEGWLQFERPDERGPGEFFGVTEDPSHIPNRNRIAFRASSPGDVERIGGLPERFGARNIEGPEWVDPDYCAVFFEDPFGNCLEIVFRQ
jgi:catechol 2,3-dioxygenase-like lactoylglutathione lyase family enzyme